jgi:hypothetical protein
VPQLATHRPEAGRAGAPHADPGRDASERPGRPQGRRRWRLRRRLRALGGGEFVWRSRAGITPDGRIIFVYGPALNVRGLAGPLQRAGAVRAMQLDLNPDWMSFMCYRSARHPADPAPVSMQPHQAHPPQRFCSMSSRDLTAAFAR